MAKTRLTKYTRARICESVLKATKKLHTEREAIEKDTRAACMELVRSSQPPGFYEVIAAAPKEWFNRVDDLYWPGNPIQLMAATANDGDSVFGNRSSSVRLPEELATVAAYRPQMRDEQTAPFAKLAKRAAAWCEKYERTSGEIRAFLASCATVEALLERMPEMAPHVPKVQVNYPLVAPSNLLSTLLAEGFEPA